MRGRARDRGLNAPQTIRLCLRQIRQGTAEAGEMALQGVAGREPKELRPNIQAPIVPDE